MLNITCLLWGDDPSQGFMVNVSPKDTIYNLKQKIVEYLDYGNKVSRKMRLIKLKEFITLDDERLRHSSDPKDLFNSEELDKPFQILDDYFSSKDDNLKEFPLDIIVVIDNDKSIPIAVLDKKEKETEIMAPRKPIGTVVRESALVTNNPIVFNKQMNIDPSSFPSPPSFISDEDVKGTHKTKNINNVQSNNSNINSEIVPRTKSLIFNIDRFPSPPDDNDNNIINVNNTNNNLNNNGDNVSSKDKYVVYDIDQFPDAPMSEDFSITSKLPLTTTEDAPPSYDAISNKNNNIPSSSNNNNLYNSNMNNFPGQILNQYDIIKKDKKSITIRKSVLITACLCIGVMISTFLAVILGKLILDKGREGPQQMKKISYVVGKVKSIDDNKGKHTSTIIFATTTVNKPYPTYIISSNDVKNKEDKEVNSKLFFKNPENTEVSWKINEVEDLAMSVEIKDLIMRNTGKNKKRDYYYDYKRNKFTEYLVDNNNQNNKNLENIENNDSNSNYFGHPTPYIPPNSFTPTNAMYENESGVPNNSNGPTKPIDQNQDLIKEIIDSNDFSIKLNIQVKRIMELPNNETNYVNYIELIPENELEKPVIVDTSKNISGGFYEVRRVYRQISPLTNEVDKEIEVYQKIYTCNSKCTNKQKDEYGLEIDPTKYKLAIFVKKWNFISPRDHSRLQVELSVNSTKMYWSDLNTNVIHFDKGQITMKYGEKGVLGEKGMASDKIISEYNMFLVNGTDIYTDKPYSTIIMDIFGRYERDETNRLKHDHPVKALIGINAEMTSYNILKSITSSSLSRIKISHYLWFITLIPVILNYFMI